jgi:hypothetical protein
LPLKFFRDTLDIEGGFFLRFEMRIHKMAICLSALIYQCADAGAMVALYNGNNLFNHGIANLGRKTCMPHARGWAPPPAILCEENCEENSVWSLSRFVNRVTDIFLPFQHAGAALEPPPNPFQKLVDQELATRTSRRAGQEVLETPSAYLENGARFEAFNRTLMSRNLARLLPQLLRRFAPDDARRAVPLEETFGLLAQADLVGLFRFLLGDRVPLDILLKCGNPMINYFQIGNRITRGLQSIEALIDCITNGTVSLPAGLGNLFNCTNGRNQLGYMEIRPVNDRVVIRIAGEDWDCDEISQVGGARSYDGTFSALCNIPGSIHQTLVTIWSDHLLNFDGLVPDGKRLIFEVDDLYDFARGVLAVLQGCLG